MGGSDPELQLLVMKLLVQFVTERFSVPLESAKTDCSLVQGEWDDMVDYGKTYLNLVQDD
jgi:hypothetical protein